MHAILVLFIFIYLSDCLASWVLLYTKHLTNVNLAKKTFELQVIEIRYTHKIISFDYYVNDLVFLSRHLLDVWQGY